MRGGGRRREGAWNWALIIPLFAEPQQQKKSIYIAETWPAYLQGSGNRFFQTNKSYGEWRPWNSPKTFSFSTNKQYITGRGSHRRAWEGEKQGRQCYPLNNLSRMRRKGEACKAEEGRCRECFQG